MKVYVMSLFSLLYIMNIFAATINDKIEVINHANIIKVIPNVTPLRADCCIVELSSGIDENNSQIWIFGESNDEGTDTGKLYKCSLDLDAGMLTLLETLPHNLGHCNSLEYHQETDCLIMGNGSGDYSLPGKIYIIENATRQSHFTLNENVIVIDCSANNFGAKMNVVWGEGSDLAYCLLNDGGKFMKIKLGKSTQILDYGRFIPGSEGFNGTFSILETYQQPDHGYETCVQGATYYKNKLVYGFGHNEGIVAVRIADFRGGELKMKSINYKQIDDSDNEITTTYLGITHYGDYLLGLTGLGLVVFEL